MKKTFFISGFLPRAFFLTAFVFFCTCNLKATHNRAGEITYEWMGGFTYKATITTYTKESSQADRDELVLYWGDGDSSKFLRQNGPDLNPKNNIPDGESLGGDIKKNIYTNTHTYPGAGKYMLYMIDLNRNGGINNIPNSIDQPFAIRSLLIINDLLGNNNSPTLLNPPIDIACANNCFMHNPAAFDKEGDSLAYKLVTCLGSGGQPIFGYSIPPITTIPGSFISIDPITGDFIWCAPPNIGQYNIAILIEEYRNGYLVGSILRDMQIDVTACTNKPPIIQEIKDTCVVAGNTLTFDVIATDSAKEIITLTAAGGPLSPYVQPPAAVFNKAIDTSLVQSNFSWQATCNHVRNQPYLVVFKAIDNNFVAPLADFESVRIKVVAPAPTNPTATPSGSKMILNWEASPCPKASCYKIYRHEGYTGWVHDHCETGVPSYTGYQLVGSTSGLNSTTFIDDNNGSGLIHGVDYCYMVVACFPDGAESYATYEFCNHLVRDVPIITNVSVSATDAANGKIYVRWIKPIADTANLDTIKHPGPYEFRLMRADGFNLTGAMETTKFSSPYFNSLNDTVWTDSLLNTIKMPYTYRIDFYANSTLIGSTHTASSVYQTIQPNDNKLKITWKELVPWTNTKYVVYKVNSSMQYILLDTVTEPVFSDTGLINGQIYCYIIESIGYYSDTTLPYPIINYSQIACGSPVDKTPPCTPLLTVFDDCKLAENKFTWNNPNLLCSDDVVGYNLYYAPEDSADFTLLISFGSENDTTYLYHNSASIAGCFMITAVDSFNNESAKNAKVCVDNCPVYELPNVFTPNGDGLNDRFRPFPYQYVKDVEMRIFNRWGDMVFETTNPDIGWDGNYRQSKKMCNEGTYFYVCVVNEIRLNGITPRVIKGFIDLRDNEGNSTLK